MYGAPAPFRCVATEAGGLLPGPAPERGAPAAYTGFSHPVYSLTLAAKAGAPTAAIPLGANRAWADAGRAAALAHRLFLTGPADGRAGQGRPTVAAPTEARKNTDLKGKLDVSKWQTAK